MDNTKIADSILPKLLGVLAAATVLFWMFFCVQVIVKDCKKKWASLRNDFRKKHREMSTTVSGETSGNLPQLDEDENESSNDQSQGTRNSTLPASNDDSPQPAVIPPLRKKAPTRCSKKKVDTSAIDREVIKAFRGKEKDPVPADENELFFKSLLPIMKTLDMMQALELRGKIQRLVMISFMRATKGSGTPAPQQSSIPSPQAGTSSSRAGAAHHQFQHSQ